MLDPEATFDAHASTSCTFNWWIFSVCLLVHKGSGSHVHLGPRPCSSTRRQARLSTHHHKRTIRCAANALTLPLWPGSHRMYVIARRLCCLRWLAHGSWARSFLWRLHDSAHRFLFCTTTHTTNLKSQIGDGFPSDTAVLGTCGTWCLKSRLAQDGSYRAMKTN